MTERKKIDMKNNIQDERFKFIQNDPRFSLLSKKSKKVKLDDRFQKVLKEPRFQQISAVDKYGRKQKNDHGNKKEMEQLYYTEDNQQGNNKKEQKKKTQKIQKASDISEQSDDQSQKSFEWNEESSSEISEEISSQNEDNWLDDQDENIKLSENTSSILAMQNYDWTQIKAEDIMLLSNSFKSKEGIIKSVRVYPSDLGIKKMKEEQEQGPSNIWKQNQDQKKQINEEEEGDQKKKQQKEKLTSREINAWIANQNDENNDLDPIKLRKYEKERMKYYYAIIECDSVVTAEKLYEEMNDMEFEMSALKIDLRFVPQGMIFPHQPCQECYEVPQNYKGKNFLNRALQHTNVKLTWEEPDTDRFALLHDKKIDLDTIDVSKYIASGSEDQQSDDNEDDQISIDQENSLDQNESDIVIDDDKSKKKNQSRKDWHMDFDKKKRRYQNDIDLKITFNTGFDDLGNKILEKQNQKNESVFERQQRLKKERKLASKKQKKEGLSGQDEFFIEADEKEQKYKEELELLVDEKEEKQNKGKKKFQANLDDQRFGAMFKDSKYAIDPTHKEFKEINSRNVLKEQIERKKKIKS